MKKLIQGIVDFRENLTDSYRQLFAELALGQKPDALFVACSDSRVVPNLFASTNPGDLFVIRNIGNLIPPAISEDLSTLAALEFSIYTLNISNIIVCGHSECGAMIAITRGLESLNQRHIASWLKHGENSLRRVQEGLKLNPALTLHNQVSQVNVLQQMDHIASHPFLMERIKKKQLRIHGWWFDIARAEVYCYEPHMGQFVVIDAQEAKSIMDRLGIS